MTANLYIDSFGFSERPFTLLPDPDFLYWSRGHSRAYAVLEYGIATCSPLTVVTGEVGAGKTTLVQHLLTNLGDEIRVGLISNAQGDRDDLLRWVLNALNIEVPPGTDYVGSFQVFQDYLIEEYAAGRRVVLFIDEAQNLSMEALEELRLLTNINVKKDELLQLVLVGQPELRDIIQRPELKQFAQRVTVTYHLQPMDLETTAGYIMHRLRHVGGSGDEFSPAAITLVHKSSGGVPRVVNRICDIALVYAATEERKYVGVDLVRELLADGLFVSTAKPSTYFLTNRVAENNEAAE